MAAGAGPYLYESWVYYPLVRYPERFALPFPSFFPLSSSEPFELWTKLVIYMPVVVYPAAAVALFLLARRARWGDAGARHEGRALLTVTLAGIAGTNVSRPAQGTIVATFAIPANAATGRWC